MFLNNPSVSIEEPAHIPIRRQDSLNSSLSAKDLATSMDRKSLHALHWKPLGEVNNQCESVSFTPKSSLGFKSNHEIPFDGYTWNDWRLLGINLRYDFAKYGCPAANHVKDSEDWQ